MITIEEDRITIYPAIEKIWLTQCQIADTFGVFTGKISGNIRAILKADILDEREVCRLHRYDDSNSVELYNLEMIAALAFRINSRKAK